MKDFVFFQQLVAERHGCRNFDDLIKKCVKPMDVHVVGNEVIEAYAQHRYEEGYAEGSGENDDIYNHAWNDALRWAAEQVKPYITSDEKKDYATFNKSDILKGLKDE